MMNLRVVELFAGLGGLHCAWPEANVVAAFDINTQAQRVYEANFGSKFHCKTIESLTVGDFEALEADVWWLSPPCQPYTKRGNQRDWHDTRTTALRHLMQLIASIQPGWLVLENVSAFEGSQTSQRLRNQLLELGYSLEFRQICPTEMGWPNRRNRFYLLASNQRDVPEWMPLPQYHCSWQELLARGPARKVSSQVEPILMLSNEDAQKFESALDRVGWGDDSSVTACFASSYGKAILNSGTYIEEILDGKRRYRRFSPHEVSALLGFPDTFDFANVRTRTAWKLLGNSLSLPVVRYVVKHIANADNPQLEPTLPWLQDLVVSM